MKIQSLIILLFCFLSSIQAQWDAFQNLNFNQSVKDSMTGQAYWQSKDFVKLSTDYVATKASNTCLKITGEYEENKPGYVYQEHAVEVKEFTRLRISARLKTEDIKDGSGDIYCYTKNGEQWLDYQTLGESVISGTTDWTEVSIELWLNPLAKTLRIGATSNGKGTLWIDDFKLETIEMETCETDPEHFSFMKEAMGVIAEHSLYRADLDTVYLMNTWQRISSCATSIEDIHRTLGTILRMIDNHSFYMPKTKVDAWETTSTEGNPNIIYSKGHRIDEEYAYIWMPHFSSGNAMTNVAFANQLQNLIDSLDHENLKGWVLDLRDNQGGNCWPMLAGIGPILGEGVCGYFKDGGDFRSWSYQKGGSYMSDAAQTEVLEPYTTYLKNAPVAVLTGPKTASSGEVVTAAFKNRPNSRSFGTHTAGYSTGNANYSLSDGSMIFLASSVYTDRDKNEYLHGLTPDVEVGNTQETVEDLTLQRALLWLKKGE